MPHPMVVSSLPPLCYDGDSAQGTQPSSLQPADKLSELTQLTPRPLSLHDFPPLHRHFLKQSWVLCWPGTTETLSQHPGCSPMATVSLADGLLPQFSSALCSRGFSEQGHTRKHPGTEGCSEPSVQQLRSPACSQGRGLAGARSRSPGSVPLPAPAARPPPPRVPRPAVRCPPVPPESCGRRPRARRGDALPCAGLGRRLRPRSCPCAPVRCGPPVLPRAPLVLPVLSRSPRSCPSRLDPARFPRSPRRLRSLRCAPVTAKILPARPGAPAGSGPPGATRFPRCPRCGAHPR